MLRAACRACSRAQFQKFTSHLSAQDEGLYALRGAAITWKRWQPTIWGRSWASTSVNKAFLNRDQLHWKPGQEPGLDPHKRDDVAHQSFPCEITVVDFDEDKIETRHLDNASLLDWISQQGSAKPSAKCRWINVDGESWDVIQALGRYKNLHSLAIEDLVNRETRTKADWYSDHVYISLTLQKLVRPLDSSAIQDPNESGKTDARQRSTKSRLRKLFQRKGQDATSQNANRDGFVVAEQRSFDHSSPRRLRTLQGQRFRAGSNHDRVAFMESRSPLTQMNLAVCAEQVSIFLLSDNTVISFFESSAADVEKPIFLRLNTKDTILRRSCDASMLTQAIIDTIIDHALPVASVYKEVIGDLEMEVLTEPNLGHAKDLYVITSEIAAMRDFINPIASLVASLHSQGLERSSKALALEKRMTSDVHFSAATKTYLADVEDHCFLILQTFDQLHHSAQGMINLIFNTITARQNESMKQLTAATIIFLPLTFITGYFGMNLTEFPNLEHNELWFWSIAAPIATMTTVLLGRRSIARFFWKARHRGRVRPKQDRRW